MMTRTDAATVARLKDHFRLLVAPNPVDESVLAVLHEILDDTLTPTRVELPSRFSSKRERRAGAARRHPAAPSPARRKARPSSEDVWRSLRQLRRATYPIVDRVRERISPAPEDTIQQALALCRAKPEDEDVLGYLRRFASVLLDLADLVHQEE
ncbi:hypothetical protein ACIRQY_35355 [Streptomyces sp. NPDC101490]|uniref:hypothetical protein n=1 Tax=Streptomyces sp. NPDC101490 TaxID=3366143 RepID=UPI0038227411